MKKLVIAVCLMCLLGGVSAAFGQRANRQPTSVSSPNTATASVKNSAVDAVTMSLEDQVLQEINNLRSNPALYVQLLEERRKHYAGNELRLPNETAVVTSEGVAAVDDAIQFLKQIKPSAKLADANGLKRAAQSHLHDMIKSGKRGHFGSDGSSPEQRIEAYGNWGGEVKELISYYATTPRRMVINWLIDDGVKTRGHRQALVNNSFTSIGINSGTSDKYGKLCVLVMTQTFAAKP